MNYSPNKVLKMFALEDHPCFSLDILSKAQEQGEIPLFAKSKNGRKKSWGPLEIGKVGRKFGFIKKPSSPLVICSFVTKGGVLKTSLTLNIARTAALHGIKTCVVGLDMQGDITAALGFSNDIENEDNFEKALQKVNSTRGLFNLFTDPQSNIDDLILGTDLPDLKFIPETPELVNLERSISTSHKREYWLESRVIAPLKEKFDLILIDASPNWNLLITNALVSCDFLVSPLECKINNFRNFQVFNAFVNEFKKDLDLSFTHLYVPSRWQKQRKLSVEILDWYRENVPNCSQNSLPESAVGEESSAMSLAVSEYSPGNPLALIYNQLVKEVFEMAKLQKTKAKNQRTMMEKYKEVTNGIDP